MRYSSGWWIKLCIVLPSPKNTVLSNIILNLWNKQICIWLTIYQMEYCEMSDISWYLLSSLLWYGSRLLGLCLILLAKRGGGARLPIWGFRESTSFHSHKTDDINGRHGCWVGLPASYSSMNNNKCSNQLMQLPSPLFKVGQCQARWII